MYFIIWYLVASVIVFLFLLALIHGGHPPCHEEDEGQRRDLRSDPVLRQKYIELHGTEP